MIVSSLKWQLADQHQVYHNTAKGQTTWVQQWESVPILPLHLEQKSVAVGYLALDFGCFAIEFFDLLLFNADI